MTKNKKNLSSQKKIVTLHADYIQINNGTRILYSFWPNYSKGVHEKNLIINFKSGYFKL